MIPLCAALAGQDTGDARQAIHLLSTACDIALDDGRETVEETHVRNAREEIQEETIGKGIRGETTQRKIALLTVLEATLAGESPEGTTQLYCRYKRLTKLVGVDTYQQGTFREKLNDLVHGNILEGDRHGRGRGRGMTNLYSLAVDPTLVIDKVGEDARLSEITEQLE